MALILAILLSPLAAQEQSPELDAIYKRGFELYQAGKYLEAIPIAEEYIGAAASRFGEESLQYANGLGYLGVVLQGANRLDEAEALFKRALLLKEKVLGPENVGVADALHNLAELYRKQGRLAQAEPLYRRTLNIAEATLGPEHQSVAIVLSNLAELYRSLGREVEAASMVKRSATIREKASHEARIAEVANLQAQVRYLYQAGKYAEAIPVAQRALGLAELEYGLDHPQVGTSVNDLGALFHVQGRYTEAEPLLKRGLALREKSLGPEHADVALSLRNLAFLYLDQGRYAEAEPLYKRALAIRENALGVNDVLVAASLNDMAMLFDRQGRYADAEPLYRRALSIREQALGADHPDVGSSQNNLGGIYYATGRYAEAEQLSKRALAIIERTLGPDHPTVGTSVFNLAVLLGVQGRNAEAEPLFKRALAIREKALGADHPDVAASLDTLGGLYRTEGRYAEAEPFLQRSQAIRERALGAGHPDLGISLNSLAQLYEVQGRYADAEQFYNRARTIWEVALGSDHPLVGTSLNNLAKLYWAQGRYADAEPLYRRAIAISERGLGPDHLDIADRLNNLAFLYFAQGQWAHAASYWRQSTQVIIRRAKRSTGDAGQILSGRGKSEAERASYRFWGLVKALYRLAGIEERSPELAADAFSFAQWALSSEASASLAQMATRQVKGNSALARLVRERQDLVGEWQARDRELIVAASQRADRRDAASEQSTRTRIAAIDRRIAGIDKSLSKNFPDFAALGSSEPLNLLEARGLLRANEALLLLLDTRELNPTPEETFLWVVTKTDMRWVRIELGTRELTARIAALRCGLDSAAWNGEGALSCADLLKIALDKAPKEGELLPFDLARAHDLYQTLFGQVADLIKGKHLLIVPSGPLTQLPFQVLVSEKPDDKLTGSEAYRRAAWLSRSSAITVLPAVSSLKALRQYAKTSRATKQLIGFGNPLLDGPDDGYRSRAKLAQDRQQCPKIAWRRVAGLFGVRGGVRTVAQRGGLVEVSDIRGQEPLPETADELCSVARDLRVPDNDILLGGRATEREIKALSENGSLAAYRIVHFATHGVLAGELTPGAEPGLILTPPDMATAEDDGYLSASEIAGLKLDADWVILSACNTAAGGSDKAEALSGLARAFFYAGARALLVSHWAVYSDSTVKLITKALSTMAADSKVGRSEALRRSMLALIDKGEPKQAHPSYWAPFVVVGEGAAR